MLPCFNKIYRPIQPLGKQGGVLYTEFTPNTRLSTFVHCYWELKTTNSLSAAFQYRILPDGCMDIYFDLKHPDQSYVTGFTDGYIDFSLGEVFHYAGIRFLPGFFPLLFGVSASELKNISEKLKLIAPSLATDHLTTLEKPASPCIIESFDRMLLQHLEKTKLRIDNRFFNALSFILTKKGALNITADIDTGVSPRQLRRFFDFYIGGSPKTFSKVVRFQHTLANIMSPTGKRSFHNADGYYDQAHYIKEFKAFSGMTPTELM